MNNMERDMILSEIDAERQRQITKHDYDAAHDATHVDGELAMAAASYALANTTFTQTAENVWPFRDHDTGLIGYKPRSRHANLIRAAALIVAEIERLDAVFLAEKT